MAIGTYVDTEDLFGLSKVYIKTGSNQQSTKYLYKVTTDTPSQSTWWYISTTLHSTPSEMYDIRWSIPNGDRTDVASIANRSSSVKCNAIENGAPSGDNLATVTQVTECRCDYNYGGFQNTCGLCSKNTYKNTISNKACTGCPWNLENAIIATCTCKPGSFQEGAERVGETGGPCKQCAVGFYNEDGGSVQCTRCPANSSSPQNSDKQTNCICNIGFTGPNGGPCTMCQAGKYKNTSGDVQCTDCAIDQYSNAIGATSYSACQYCTSNSMAPAGSDQETACVCNAGWFGVNNTGCSKCPANTYSNISDSQACTSCPAGHIAPSGGSSIGVCVCIQGSDVQCQCARHSTQVHEIQVRVSRFECFKQDIAGGVYIPTTDIFNNGSLVYYRAEPEARYLYKKGNEWYISKKFNDSEYEIKYSGCRITPHNVQELANHVEFGCIPALMCQGQVLSNAPGIVETYKATLCQCDYQYARSNTSGICLEQEQPTCDSGEYYTGGFLSMPLPTGIDAEYVYHEFRHNGTGSSTVTSIEVMENIQSAEILIIGGGGGGGGSVPQHRGCGGGGAGRLLWYNGITINAGIFEVTVGAGGNGGLMSWGYTSGGNGMSSNFLGYTAIGGGAGGGTSIESGSGGRNGHSGGSGGGGGDPQGASGNSVGTNSQQSFGNRGGKSVVNTRQQWNGAGAGGGGAGGIGQDTSGGGNENPGLGGPGISISITGTIIQYARGGNGNIATDFPATVQHMGHGGNGGKGYGHGDVGSSGVVIIRYKRQGTPFQAGFVGSSGVLIIRKGENIKRNSGTCVACPPGSSSEGGKTIILNCVCKPGWTDFLGTCTVCLRGTYKQGRGNSPCEPCHANAMTNNTGATSSDLCECQADIGWSLKPGNHTRPSCEQIVEETGGQFELAVALSDFANNVGQVQTNFTNALAMAFDANPANVTLVYYETYAADTSLGLRRLLQQNPTSTTVQAKVRVFASVPRVSTAEFSARLRTSVPGIKIQQLRMGSEINTPALPRTPSIPALPPKNTTTGTNLALYGVIACAALLLILICAVVLLNVQRRHNIQNDDDPSKDEASVDMGQNMESTEYRPHNMKNLLLSAHCGDAHGAYAHGAYLYNCHAYDAFDCQTYTH